MKKVKILLHAIQLPNSMAQGSKSGYSESAKRAEPYSTTFS